jgi:hypothetical protein
MKGLFFSKLNDSHWVGNEIMVGLHDENHGVEFHCTE